MSENNVIEVHNLSATFDNRRVLSDVSFTAKQGEISVILGASGSGKTTILKHLLGLYPVQKGKVNVLGKDVSTLTEVELHKLYLKMGVFYQNGALLNSLSVAENVALPLEQHTLLPSGIIEKMVRTKLNLLHLEDAYYLFPSQLSGGMLKRAALTRAIIMDPVLIFCDEPGAGLDPVTLADLDKLIISLKEQMGMSVVMVTHEVTSIMRIADKVIFVENGSVIFQGNLSDATESGITELRDFFNKGRGASNDE